MFMGFFVGWFLTVMVVAVLELPVPTWPVSLGGGLVGAILGPILGPLFAAVKAQGEAQGRVSPPTPAGGRVLDQGDQGDAASLGERGPKE